MPILELPKYFNLIETLKVLQRGQEDPINFCHEGKWQRGLSFSNDQVVVEVFEQSKKLVIEILTGDREEDCIKKEIGKLLGFDDPLIHTGTNGLIKPEYENIKQVCSIPLPQYSSLFETIVQTIIGQQVSAIVANKMRSSFIKEFGECIHYNNRKYYLFPKASDVKNISIEKIKSMGMSLVKAKAIIDAAEHFENQTWLKELRLEIKNIEKIYMLLTDIYGVGVWTASWFILRGLRQFNHIPSTDLVIRKAMSWWWGKDKLLSAEKINKLSEIITDNKGIICYRIMLTYMQKFMYKC